MVFAGPYPKLQGALHGLETGKTGFEALCAELLGRLTGNRIRLMSSGDQHGVDALEDAHLPVRRAMQAKRYLSKTSLDDTALIGEMSEAKSAYPGLDCWILATTKAVMGKQAGNLNSHAALLGVGLAILDWGGTEDNPPPLAVLCAAFPEVTLGRCPDTELEIQGIRSATNYNEALQQLIRDVNQVTLVFQNTADAAKKRLDTIFEDPNAARSLAGPSPAFLRDSKIIERKSTEQAVVEWWAKGARIAGLVGNEGTGKTWLALQAARHILDTPKNPVFLFLKSAACAKHKDIIESALESLCELSERNQLRLTDARVFWDRKLRAWASSATTVENIFVVVDGLDEHRDIDWVTWLTPAFEQQWKGLFRVLLTSRKDFWSHNVNKLNALQEETLVHAIAVGNFSDAERDSFLTANRIDLADLSKEVSAAALHPRTAFHLVRLRDQLSNLKAVTRQQLMLLDFKNRWELKDHKFARDDHFIELVRKFANQAREAALKQKTFSIEEGATIVAAADLVGRDRNSMQFALNELVDEKWFQRSSVKPTAIEFTDETLPDAIGIALASELRECDAGSAKAELDRFLEPWGADDITDKVLRMCAVSLVLDKAVSDEICKIVLLKWYARLPRSSAGQDFWMRLHSVRLGLFLQLLESAHHREYDWLAEWALVRSWEDYPKLRASIEAAVFKWMAITPLSPAARHGDADHRKYMDRERDRQLSRVRSLKRRGSGWYELLSREVSSDNFQSAVRIISCLPRQPFVPAIIAWAISRTGAGHCSGLSKIAWLLRENKHDEELTTKEISEWLNALENTKSLLLSKAASAIYVATGEKDAEIVFDTHQPLSEVEANEIKFVKEFETDDWRYLVSEISPHAPDSSIECDPKVTAALKEVAAKLPGLDAKHLPQRINDEWFYALMRWATEEYASSVRHIASDATHEVDSKFLVHTLGLLNSTQVECAVGRIMAQGNGHLRSINDIENVLAARLFHMPLDEQFAALTDPSNVSVISSELGPLIKPPSREENRAFIDSMDFSGSVDELRQKLFALKLVLDTGKAPTEYRPLPWAVLLIHPDERIRQFTFEIATRLRDKSAANILLASGWSGRNEKNQRFSFLGSTMLLALDDNELKKHLSILEPQVVGRVMLDRPEIREHALEEWEKYLEREIATARTSASMGSYGYQDQDYIREMHSLYVASRAENAIRIFNTGWKNPKARINFDPMLPGLDLAWALNTADTQLCIEYWTAEKDRWDQFGSASRLDLMPFELPEIAAFDGMRDRVWESAESDGDLFDVITTAQENNNAWLLRTIRKDFIAKETYKKARAWTAAGFLDEPSGGPLWQELESNLRTTKGWLAKVAVNAQRHFSMGLNARHWFKKVCSAESEAEAYSAYQLGLAVIDPRYRYWFGGEGFNVPYTSQRCRWINYNKDRSERAKATRKKLDETRFHTPIISDWIQH